ncbi:hypothetical protein P7228_09145 [Altererythrobacter arenosus]|uniref:DUF4402 domain-containing protein n=1 Tax=Altererythrobacter arenosus TaxID=3032592 RepID=A0ABY8FMB7_9SPHN|nr:hypothetical protein [Altererythrobacter sp. CAU 1644]WFL76166.1 hypothetical protein P7228_09145 [Altererythrobacter sp. CAU 1644]
MMKTLAFSSASTRVAIIAAGILVAANPAKAETQGTLGATSQGSIDIQASVPSRARITKLVDVSFLNQDPTSPATSSQSVCVWSNTSTGAYSITATGSGTGNAFTLSDGSDEVAYSVQWNQAAGQSSGSTLATGAASATLTSAATHQTCTTGPAFSASLIVGIDTTELSSMNAGSVYSGSLTLLVTPQ